MSGARKLAVAAWVSGLSGVLMAVGFFWSLWAGYQSSTLSSESMSPSYRPGDRVVFERIDGDEVRRGDVVLYSAPERFRSDGAVMHRVIGVGGDHIVCCTGDGVDEHLMVNGEPLDEPYVKDGVVDGLDRPYDVKVPEGRLFVLGDHRANAMDSRLFADDHGGTVPVGAVQGRVTDDVMAPVLLGLAGLLGGAVALAGLGLGVAALVVRRRRPVPVRPQVPTHV